ncbi:hypothetical protein ACHAXS_012923 [Conticribra weissflogii]
MTTSSSRADVGPLHDALHSPSPLGTTLDKLHSKSNDNQMSYNCVDSSARGNASSDYSVFSFGEGSIASAASSAIANAIHHTTPHWMILVFGQLLSFFLASAGAASEELTGTCKVSVPLTQTALVMFLMMIFGGRKLKGWCIGCCHKRKVDTEKEVEEDEESFSSGRGSVQWEQQVLHLRKNSTAVTDEKQIESDTFTLDIQGQNAMSFERLKSRQPRRFCWGLQTVHGPLLLYFFVGLVGVEAYYLIFVSFRYTSFTFIYLVMALAIPSALVFTKVLLGREYQFMHLLGGFVCVAGILINTLSDIKDNKIGNKEDVERHIMGDMMAICGAILLGLEDVLSEMVIKHYGGVDELFFMKGFFGVGISLFQLLMFEREGVATLFRNIGNEPCELSTRLVFLGVYVIFQFMNVVGEVQFLSISEAALLSLSLLTSDLWATIFSVVEEGILPSISYYASFLLIVAGIVLYESAPSPLEHGIQQANGIDKKLVNGVEMS